MTVAFEIVTDEAPVPVTPRRGRAPQEIDPKVVALYNDTLKPRGIDSQAVVLKTNNRAAALKTLRELRQLAEKDEPRVSIGKTLVATTDDPNGYGPQTLTVWLTKYTERKRKDKQPVTEEQNADAVAAAAEIVAVEAPEAIAPAFVEPAHEDKPKSRWGR